MENTSDYFMPRPLLFCMKSEKSVCYSVPDNNYLLSEDEAFIASAEEKYGSRGAKQARELMEEVTGLFAGGEMAEEDMDVMMRAIQEAYWIAKENKKNTPPRNTVPKNKSVL